ncbi:hypothetical protein MOXK23_20740 [Moraxella sp. K23]
MPLFFDNKDLPRTEYNNSLSLKNYFKECPNFFMDDEYVVTWYDSNYIEMSPNKSNIGIEVTFLNISKNTYFKYDKELKKYITSSDRLIKLLLPINLLHKTPIGSIWKSGSSIETFEFKEFDIKIADRTNNQASANFEIYSLYESNKAANVLYAVNKDIKSTPERKNEAQLNTNKFPVQLNTFNYLPTLKYDNNPTINVKFNDKTYVIHPITLFVSHYGYSMDFKRYLSAYSYQTLSDLLEIERNLNDQPIKIPYRFSLKDAIIIYEWKHNNFTKNVIQHLSNSINLNKTKNAEGSNENWRIKIKFWHEQEILIRMKGIEFSDGNVLCTSITGMSQPQGNDIDVMIRPSKSKSFSELSQIEQNAINNQQPSIKVINRPQNIEPISIVKSPVNNLTVATLVERFLILGNQRNINKVTKQPSDIDPHTRTLTIPQPDTIDYAVGEKQGATGQTGLANCFLDTDIINNRSRFDRIWHHAKEFNNNKNVWWFTFKQGFKQSDDFYVMSFADAHRVNFANNYSKRQPEFVMLIKLIHSGITYYIMEFGDNLKGIAYRAEKNEEFTDEHGTFAKILGAMTLFNGVIKLDYPASFGGKLKTFIHPSSDNSNWVKNAINRFN